MPLVVYAYKIYNKGVRKSPWNRLAAKPRAITIER
jgi:hypothetical protein